MQRIACLLCTLIVLMTSAPPASAYWIWTPQTKRWVNPATEPKDTPKAQLEYAQQLTQVHDHLRAVREYLKLVRRYPKSVEAPEAQFAAGQSYEALHRPYHAFLQYKKLVEIYPYSPRFKDAIGRSFAIGEAYANGQKFRPIQPVPLAVPAYDKAIEIFEHIVTQAPYGEFGDRAQLQLAQTYRKMGQYGDAMKAFQKVVEDYKQSPLVEEARYNVAYCAKQLSLKPNYDQDSTDQAITWFREFITTHPGSELLPEAQQSLQQLRAHKAESLFRVAQFYEQQRKWASAAIYYRRVVTQYDDTPWASQAVTRLTALEQRGEIPPTTP